MENNTFCESATEMAVPTNGAVHGVANKYLICTVK